MLYSSELVGQFTLHSLLKAEIILGPGKYQSMVFLHPGLLPLPQATAGRGFLDFFSPDPATSHAFPCSELSQWESVTLTSRGVHNSVIRFFTGTLGKKYRSYSVELQPLQLGSRFEAAKICQRIRFKRDLSSVSLFIAGSCLESLPL